MALAALGGAVLMSVAPASWGTASGQTAGPSGGNDSASAAASSGAPVEVTGGQFLLPGADAFAPILPLAPAGTTVPDGAPPAELADVPTAVVSFSYFGPDAIVTQLLSPQLVSAERPLPIRSGPDENAIDFGTRPAGTVFVVFFIREGDAYVLDMFTGNYGWIPIRSEDVARV